MASAPHDPVDRCVAFILSFLGTEGQRKHLSPARQRQEHDRALAYLNRLSKDTLRRAMSRLYALGDQQARAKRGQPADREAPNTTRPAPGRRFW